MKLYDCKVRVGGSLYNEVPKPGVTAPEIIILRHIHGGEDSVVQIVDTGAKAMTAGDAGEKPHARTQSEERERLIEVYGAGLRGQQINKTSPAQAMSEIFGLNSRLPDDIPGAVKAKDKPAAAPVAEEPELEENLEEA